MTSLFEQVGSGPAEMPVDLITQGARGVSLLEFLPFDARGLRAEESPQQGAPEDHAAAESALQLRVMIDAARTEAEAATRSLLRLEHELEVAEHRSVLARLCESFVQSREAYFARAEEQVIRLALSVACRVLCREVQADVLHLQAVVRAALTRVTDGSGVVLRVPELDAAAWQTVFLGQQTKQVEVLADTTLVHGGCTLETTIGRVELGVATQLEEIGRGFQELLRVSEERLI